MSDPTEIVPLVMFGGDGPMKMARAAGPISDPVDPPAVAADGLSDEPAATAATDGGTAATDGEPADDATTSKTAKTGKS